MEKETNHSPRKKIKQPIKELLEKLKVQGLFFISHLLHWAVKILNDLDYKLTNYSFNETKYDFNDLSPSKRIEKDNLYHSALEWALRNEDIQNIAITGPYGSGKSSILRSFEWNYPQYRYLNISLATFSESAAVSDDLRKHIETSILQQILYRVRESETPDSSYRRIARSKPLYSFLIAVVGILTCISAAYLIKPDILSKNFVLNAFEALHKENLKLFALIVTLAGATGLLYYLIRGLRNRSITKLKVTSGEIELSNNDSSSVLNRYLEEILYFFEATNFNVVVIEDLDRFNDPEIFTKLREINTLLNSSKQISRSIKFIYAVRDEVFVDKARTKFFEFILPVIPVINAANSSDMLMRLLKKTTFQNEISEEFISDVMLYIDDMRMLKNVLNEYIIYKNKIGNSLNKDRLLGIILYKNLYPQDFAALNNDRGKVSQVLNKKSNLIRAGIEHLENKIAENERILIEVEKQFLTNIDELRSVYL
ncbi:MAG: hypothetical protein EOO43_15260, partial [Flavobacterium sp.]